MAVDDPRLQGFLAERFGASAAGVQIVPLAGDASTRRYFRLVDGGATSVLALYPQPFDGRTPFLEIRELMAGWGLPVPDVRSVDGPRGIMVLEDLGDVTLQSLLGSATETASRDSYRDALDSLLRMQAAAAQGPRHAACFSIAFDVEKLSWELHYFEKHFLEGWLGRELTSEDRSVLAESFHGLSAEIASWPRVLCHRDYHSRNLMWCRGRLHWIDFQDARMGPLTYDLASLLRDSYVDLPEGLVDELLADFRSRAAPGEAQAAFRRRFDLTAIQRNLKALGTFGFMGHVRGSTLYQAYVPRTLGYLRRNLDGFAEWSGLRRVLARHMEELQ